MTDLLALSAKVIDEGDLVEPLGRVSGELSEVADGIAVVESFSNVVALGTGDGLVLFDTSLPGLAERSRAAVRAWAGEQRVATIVYTHGHFDHVGGARAFLDEAATRGDPRPTVVAHENVPARFERYERLSGWNTAINVRQFGQRMASNPDQPPEPFVLPDVTFTTSTMLDVGGVEIDLQHARGETDDHLWAWLPSRRAIFAGDFFIWAFPNAGNPQKVQRYPLEWARALRVMRSKEPELFLPAHGLPIEGRERIATALDDVAAALEGLVRDVLHLMNEGARLDDIVHTVRVPAELLAKPYLRPTYDEPEYVVRNIWRLYGGWWDGNPANVKPAPDTDVADEVAALAGGFAALADRARELSEAGQHRMACHLVEWAALAAPDDAAVHETRAAVYRARRDGELSLMSKGIFGTAAAESEARL